MQQHYDWLGWKVTDCVTGFTGVVTHVGLDLYGCVQAIVHPHVVTENSGKQCLEESRWFDTARLVKRGKKRVMEPVPVKGDRVVAGSDTYKPSK